MKLMFKPRGGPIGIDLGSRSVKMVQFSADRSRLIAQASWDWLESDDASDESADSRTDRIVGVLRRSLKSGQFVGRDAVLCLTRDQLYLQNVRVPKAEPAETERLIHQEAAGRMPFPIADAEIRYIEAADVRQGKELLREIIVIATPRHDLAASIETIEKAGLRPVAVDIEPMAILRTYARQYRRDDDRGQRVMYVHVGHSKTAVIIAEDDLALFIKYIDVGGRLMDQAVATEFDMTMEEATAIRRNNGDRRIDQQDAEVAHSIDRAVRPIVEQIFEELSRCIRYHSVTFRGKPLARIVLSGGEAAPRLAEKIRRQFDLNCELGEPFRGLSDLKIKGRAGQWDIATGLALRETGK